MRLVHESYKLRRSRRLRDREMLEELTGGIPNSEIHRAAIDDHVGAEVVEDCGNVILSPPEGRKEISHVSNHRRSESPILGRCLNNSTIAYHGEGVTGVGDEHAGLSHGSVADGDALDEPPRVHSQIPHRLRQRLLSGRGDEKGGGKWRRARKFGRRWD